jgi:hypothetical protein
LHGIQRHRQMHDPSGSQGGITRIVVRYSDGRVIKFVPDAGRQTFSEDDILELKKVLDRSSSTAEWAEIHDRPGL